jgi:hypothetical protein
LVKVRKSVKLTDKDRAHNSATCKAVKALRDQELANITSAPTITKDDMRVVDYWATKFLPWCEEKLEIGPRKGQTRLKAITIKDHTWIGDTFLKDHFGNGTLQKYQPAMDAQFLDSLTA